MSRLRVAPRGDDGRKKQQRTWRGAWRASENFGSDFRLTSGRRPVLLARVKHVTSLDRRYLPAGSSDDGNGPTKISNRRLPPHLQSIKILTRIYLGRGAWSNGY